MPALVLADCAGATQSRFRCAADHCGRRLRQPGDSAAHVILDAYRPGSIPCRWKSSGCFAQCESAPPDTPRHENPSPHSLGDHSPHQAARRRRGARWRARAQTLPRRGKRCRWTKTRTPVDARDWAATPRPTSGQCASRARISTRGGDGSPRRGAELPCWVATTMCWLGRSRHGDGALRQPIRK